jgi:hypothetical protein
MAQWIKQVDAATDVRFFLGDPHTGKRSPDEIWLDCPDSYVERKQKIVAIIRWAVEHDYAYLWKVDDDVYVRPERLLSLERSDYCGAIVGYDTVFSGALYGLSRCSMEKLLTPDNTFAWQKYEDLWVWNRLNELGVAPLNLGGESGVHGRFRMTHRKGEPVRVNQDPPRPGNDVIASWEYITHAQMNEIHSAFDATQYATEGD